MIVVVVYLDLGRRRLEEEDVEAASPGRSTGLCGGRSFAPRAIAGDGKCALQSMTSKRVAEAVKQTDDMVGRNSNGL